MPQRDTLLIALMQLDAPMPRVNPASPRHKGHQLNANEEPLLPQALANPQEVSGMQSARVSPGFQPKENDVPRTSHDRYEGDTSALLTV
jgi:hypothetical protein